MQRPRGDLIDGFDGNCWCCIEKRLNVHSCIDAGGRIMVPIGSMIGPFVRYRLMPIAEGRHAATFLQSNTCLYSNEGGTVVLCGVVRVRVNALLPSLLGAIAFEAHFGKPNIWRN